MLTAAACGSDDTSTDDDGKGGDDPTQNQDPTPQPTAVGTPLGSETVTTIGPDGGTAWSLDGTVSIVVPAGAVAVDTPITIQRITDTGPGSVRSYAFGPDGQTFAVPVTVTMRYDDFDLEGTAPEALDIAYQDEAGYWRAFPEPALDVEARTVSSETNHFTPYMLGARAYLEPRRGTVHVDETLTLHTMICDRRADATAGKTPLVEKCVADQVPVARWKVEGVEGGNATSGTIAANGTGSAVFTAPAERPLAGTVARSRAGRPMRARWCSSPPSTWSTTTSGAQRSSTSCAAWPAP